MTEDETCKARISFGDDFGDNATTFSCQLRKGHEGPHREEGDMGYGEDEKLPYVLTWVGSSVVEEEDD